MNLIDLYCQKLCQNNTEEKINQITGMGFGADAATDALSQTNGEVESAVDLLLSDDAALAAPAARELTPDLQQLVDVGDISEQEARNIMGRL